MRSLCAHQLLAELLERPPQGGVVGEVGELVERYHHQRRDLTFYASGYRGQREAPAVRRQGSARRPLLLRHEADATASDNRDRDGGFED